VQTLSGLSRRVFKVASTFAVSWPEGAKWRRAQPSTGSASSAEWVPDGDDWATGYGR
jgi:hypothetical protein